MNSSDAAIQIYKAALESVQPAVCIRRFLSLQNGRIVTPGNVYDLNDFKNIYITGAGKATAAMALAVEEILGNAITGGIIAVKQGHRLDLKYIRQVEAGHPIPDANSVTAANEVIALLEQLTKEDLLIVLLSGGGTALLTDIPGGISLAELQRTYQLLQQCGADIHESNTVRKHLSAIKGGGFAALCKAATVCCLIISDVIGDDLSVIASGPTVADDTSNQDALKVLEKYALTQKVPASILSYLKDETVQQQKPGKGDGRFEKISNYLVANNASALQSAKQKAEALGYRANIISATLSGEAVEVAEDWVQLAKKQPPKTCLLAGGETTVTIKGRGKGGRNQELALKALSLLEDRQGITILSAGTDGTDGPTDAAGAVVNADLFRTAPQKALSIDSFLNDNDSYHFFQQAGGHIITGPTQTNVMDLMIALID